MPRPRQALLLSNFPETGIGTFGVQLERELHASGASIRFESAATTWRAFIPQCVQILRSRDPVIANVGLTSWGKSRARNLLGLWSIGARGRRGRPTTVLLHNLIETVDAQDAGYHLSQISRRFAHRGIAGLREAQIVVFSRQLADVLRRSYGIVPAREAPLPCPGPARPHSGFSEPPLAVYFGYLSPYKGVQSFVAAMESLRVGFRSAVIGGPHSLLGSDPQYQRYLTELNRRAQASGTALLGYLPADELRRTLQEAFVAVLPYTSTTGASASFTQLAGAGLPVIASDLPEFRALKEDGAGVLLVDPEASPIREAVLRLRRDRVLWDELSERQLSYARRNSWGSLADWVIQKGLQGPAPGLTSP